MGNPPPQGSTTANRGIMPDMKKKRGGGEETGAIPGAIPNLNPNSHPWAAHFSHTLPP